MKQVLNVRKAIEIEDVPAPLCGEKEILVANMFSLISAGTERHAIEIRSKNIIALGKEIQRTRPDLIKKTKDILKKQGILSTYHLIKEKMNEPNLLGYSSAGIAIEVGKEVKSIKVGDRVACGGGGYASHSEFIKVPENLCVKIPDRVEFKEAAFTTVGAIALQGVRRADVRVGERVAVIGLGLVGLLTTQILKAAGCRIIGFDVSKDRVRLAEELGIDEGYTIGEKDIFTAVDIFSEGVGLDSVIITASTSSNKPVEDALRMIRKKGKIVVVGAVGMNIPREPFYEKEADFMISTSYGPGRYDSRYEEKSVDYPIAYVRWTENRNMKTILELIDSGSVDVKKLITDIFSIEEAVKAYDAIKQANSIGVLLQYAHKKEEMPLKRKIENASISNVPSGIIRVGIIGGGNFAKNFHMPNIARIEGMTIHAIASNTGANAKNMAKKYGAKYATTDYFDILRDDDIDLVVITTRHNLHYKIAVEALNMGKHVFVEKPAAMNQKDMEKLIQTAERSGKIFMVGFNRRFSSLIEKAKSILDSSSGPVVINYRVNAGKLPSDHWLYDSVEGGGRIIGEGVHFFDLMNFIAGSTPSDISVISLNSGTPSIKSGDNVAVSIKYRNGSVGNLLYTSIGSSAYPKESLYIERNGISVEVDDFRILRSFRGREKKIKLKRQDKGHYREMECLKDTIKNGGQNPIPLKEITIAHETAFVVDRLIKEG